MIFYVLHVDFGGINLGLVCLVVNVLVVAAVHVMLHGRPVKQYAVSDASAFRRKENRIPCQHPQPRLRP